MTSQDCLETLIGINITHTNTDNMGKLLVTLFAFAPAPETNL
jgi:hypothetical protein